jgi:putative Mn2+ efflux pump MntP
VGITLAIVNSLILRSALVVGVVAFGMTLLGLEIGRKIGALWGRRCELIGGIVLIFMGLYFLWPVVRTLRF